MNQCEVWFTTWNTNDIWIVSFIWKPEDFPETSTQEKRFEVVPFKYHNLEFFYKRLRETGSGCPPPPPPFAILIKMEIRIRHNLYLQLCNLIFSYFKIKWTQLFENQNIQKGLQNTALFSLRVCALQQRWIIVWKNSCVSKFPTSSHPISLINDPSFLSDLPSGMRDWNSSHRRPLCYLYLFTEDYNVQGCLNKDGMKAIWSKKVKWQCQNLRTHVRDARDHSTWSPNRRLKSLASKSKHWLQSSFEGKLAKFYIKLKSFELQEKTHRNFVDRAHEYTHT